MDASPPRDMGKEIARLARYWSAKFAAFAALVARRFAKKVNADVTRQLGASAKAAVSASANLADAAKGAALSSGVSPLLGILGNRRTGLRGRAANAALSRQTNSVLQSVVAENVALIKKIPKDYHADVEGIVMRGIQNGRDLAYVSEELGKRYEITQRRARMIARDQTNKSTGALARVKLRDAGITEAIWLHRAGPKVPRPAHLKMAGTRFRLADGCYDEHEGRKVMPGELVNCGCACYPVIPGGGE